KVAEPIYRQARLLGILRAKRRISYNHDEDDIRWRVRYVRRRPEVITGPVVSTPFLAPVRHKTAVLDWRGYALGEYILPIEQLKGRTKETALPRLLDDIVRSVIEDFELFISEILYKDGNTAEQHLHGLESMFGTDNTSMVEPVLNPNDTYAGLSTVIGAYGGTIKGNWPVGSFTSEAIFWTPLIEKWNDNRFKRNPNEEATWENNGEKAIRYCTTWLWANQSVQPDVIIMHPDMLRQLKDSLTPYRQLQVTPKSPIVDLGIQTVQFDGLELVDDPNCPVDTAYVLSTNKMELMSMQSELIHVHQDIDRYRTKTLFFDFYGNMRIESPAFLGKLVKVT
ncbi:MAG: hypothetical protein NZ821_05960, partial [Gloeomargarita sp. SKYB31]|nr:hypothetical protein [Gloeomargarita sp. SKYB31]